ncbi:DUF5710 domain-containing protein [Brevibacillus sp. IT-7CA2]|uniref:DUF5710 domain-containing protein n=1 Tax=Brevibacillus sp. IT-7CA2 TaxID=3026436 RepID=UPI0039E0E0E8
MNRYDLRVPFSEKDYAKSLGAKWDLEKKVWYVSDEIDLEPFQKWFPTKVQSFNVRANSFEIAESVQACWKCRKKTRVFSFCLPEGFELLEEHGESVERWVRQDYSTMLSNITVLSERVLEVIQRITTRYVVNFSKTASQSYYLNHCEHCNSKQGDFYLHNEPGNAFFPMSDEEMDQIKMQQYNLPFAAYATSFSIGTFFD